MGVFVVEKEFFFESVPVSWCIMDGGLSNFKPDYTINASLLSVSHVFLIAEASESDKCDNCDSDAAKMSRGAAIREESLAVT